MTGLEYALAVFMILNLADIMTTVAAVRLGAVEQNMLARWLLSRFGVVGLYMLKLLLGGAMITAVAVLTPRHLEFVVWIWNAMLGAVVVWNSLVNYRLARGW